MDHVFIIETSDNMADCVDLPDVGKKAVAKALAFVGALDKPRNVDEFYYRMGRFFRIVKLCKEIKPFVWNRHHSQIRLYCAKGIIGGFRRSGFCQSVEQCAFAHVGQTYYTEFHEISRF
jgi:hypothetical protein